MAPRFGGDAKPPSNPLVRGGSSLVVSEKKGLETVMQEEWFRV